jgi:hypothetical protein
MATTYYFNIFLQQSLNGTYSTVTTQSVNVNATQLISGSTNPTKFGWVVKGYSYDSVTATSTQLTGDQMSVNLSSTWSRYFNQVQTVNNQYFVAEFSGNIDNINLLTAKGTGLVHPTFNIKLKSDDSDIPFQAITQASWDALGVGMQSNGVKLSSPPNGIQSVKITKASTIPAVPQGLINALNTDVAPGQNYDYSGIKYDPVNKWYVGIKKTIVPGKGTTYTALYWNPGSKGTQITSKTTIVGKDKTGLAAANNILIDAVNGQKNTSTKSPVLGQGTAPKVQSVASPSLDSARYNPQSHMVTRGYSRGLGIDVLTAIDTPLGNNSQIPTGISGQYKRVSVNPSQFVGKLGRIIQDPNTASLVNTKDPKSLWGFRYTYNPTTIQYSIQGNTSVDWTLGSNDPAALLAGNIQVTFQLYLNRIADMTQLRTNKTKGYTPPLSSPEIEGILNRGTEYDLEYLYRVCNGDPDESLGKNPMLSYNGSSSDIGILKTVPVWLYINDNMKLFGSITNINVNHAMFTLDMIPILTTIDITFTRYPAIFNVASSGKDDASGIAGFAAASGGALVANSGKFVGGTSTTAGGGTTGGNP